MIEANPDLDQRIDGEQVGIDYDDANDTLYFTLEPLTDAVYESVGNRFYFRLNPEDSRIAGIEIRNARRLLVNHMTQELQTFFNSPKASDK